MIEGEEQGEEGQGEESYAGEEKRAGDDGADGAFEAGAGADFVEIADGLHCGGGQDFACGGAKDDGGDHAGFGPVTVGGRRCGQLDHCVASSCSLLSAAGRSVRDGPWATKPTPMVMSTTPA